MLSLYTEVYTIQYLPVTASSANIDSLQPGFLTCLRMSEVYTLKVGYCAVCTVRKLLSSVFRIHIPVHYNADPGPGPIRAPFGSGSR